MSLPGLTVNAGPEFFRQSLIANNKRSKAAVKREAREAEETQRRLKREYLERQERRAA